MYRVAAGADDQPYVVWSVPYDTIGVVRPGQYELGAGTSPTILGEGKYVAITDNAEQMNVVVYRTEAGLPPDQQVVCKVPVFDFPGGGRGANSNSLNSTTPYRFNSFLTTLFPLSGPPAEMAPNV